jgi:hypothetical protein
MNKILIFSSFLFLFSFGMCLAEEVNLPEKNEFNLEQGGENLSIFNLTREDCEFIIDYQNKFLEKCDSDIRTMKKVTLNYQIILGILTFVYIFGIVKRWRKKNNE